MAWGSGESPWELLSSPSPASPPGWVPRLPHSSLRSTIGHPASRTYTAVGKESPTPDFLFPTHWEGPGSSASFQGQPSLALALVAHCLHHLVWVRRRSRKPGVSAMGRTMPRVGGPGKKMNILKCQLASVQVILLSEKITFISLSSGADYKRHPRYVACSTNILEKPKNHL